MTQSSLIWTPRRCDTLSDCILGVLSWADIEARLPGIDAVQIKRQAYKLGLARRSRGRYPQIREEESATVPDGDPLLAALRAAHPERAEAANG